VDDDPLQGSPAVLLRPENARVVQAMFDANPGLSVRKLGGLVVAPLGLAACNEARLQWFVVAHRITRQMPQHVNDRRIGASSLTGETNGTCYYTGPAPSGFCNALRNQPPAAPRPCGSPGCRPSRWEPCGGREDDCPAPAVIELASLAVYSAPRAARLALF